MGGGDSLSTLGGGAQAGQFRESRNRLLDAVTIEYEATIEDPQVFSRPWTLRLLLKRQSHMNRILEYQCQAEKEEANGEFERDEHTWYPAPIPADNDPFDAGAGANLSLPTVPPDIPRRADGKPDITGYFLAVAGVPRSHYVPAPFYALQPEGYIVALHERMSWRHIFLDGRGFLPDHMRLWQGHSVGRWDGDTLVVESRNFNGKSWLNEAGDVVSHAQTVETFTPVGPDQVMYRATVTDPIAYTRPWTIEMPFDRSGDELLEVACLEDNGDLQHLKDVRDAYRADQSQGDRP